MIRTTTCNASTIAHAIRQGEDFTTSGALKGEANPGWIHSGRMSESDAKRMRLIESLTVIDYVVYSYGTPIAYRFNGEWVVPDAKYSVTTSKHQGVVHHALSMVAVRIRP